MPFTSTHADEELLRYIDYHDGLYDCRYGLPFMERTFSDAELPRLPMDRLFWDTRRKAYCFGWSSARAELDTFGGDLSYYERIPRPDPPDYAYMADIHEDW